MDYYQNAYKLLNCLWNYWLVKYKTANTMKLFKCEPSVPGISDGDKIIFLWAVVVLQLKVLQFSEEIIFYFNC